MGSVIVELQHDALNKDIRVSDLLRKSLVISRKLKLAEFQEWIEKEMNGYSGAVPDYRLARGTAKGWNPYRGWIPVIFEDPKEGELFNALPNGQSIGEIEDMVERATSTTVFHMPYPEEIQRQLSSGYGFETQFSLFVPRAALVKALEAVRNIVLNWALKLEEEGIVGDGLAFSPKEQAAAEKSAQNVTNFYGPVMNPQVALGSSDVIQVSISGTIDTKALADFVERLRVAIPTLMLDSSREAELRAEVATLDAQSASPKPKKSIIKESLTSIRTILEGAAGSAVGQLLIEAGKIIVS